MSNVNVNMTGAGSLRNTIAGASGGGLDFGAMRPFIATNKQGQTGTYVQVYVGGDRAKPENYKIIPMNTNATLRRDEWKKLDEALMGVARERLGIVDDLLSRGLTYNLANPLGTTVLEWHDVGDQQEAQLTMDGINRSKGDRPNFQYNYIPIPIMSVDYEINARELAASRNMGNGIDVIDAENAARRIAELQEDLLLGVYNGGAAYTYGETDSRTRNGIYGYLNFPDRNLVTLSVPWDNSSITGAGIIQDVLDMKQSAINDYHYGPYQLYIPTAYETVLDNDYDATTPGTTIRERILKIANIAGIKIIDRMTADNVLLVQMTSSTVRMIQGMGLTNIQWNEEGNWVTKYKVVAISVPQVRSDQNGRCGIIHMS